MKRVFKCDTVRYSQVLQYEHCTILYITIYMFKNWVTDRNMGEHDNGRQDAATHLYCQHSATSPHSGLSSASPPSGLSSASASHHYGLSSKSFSSSSALARAPTLNRFFFNKKFSQRHLLTAARESKLNAINLSAITRTRDGSTKPNQNPPGNHM